MTSLNDCIIIGQLKVTADNTRQIKLFLQQQNDQNTYKTQLLMLDITAEIMLWRNKLKNMFLFYSDSFVYMCSMNKVHLFKLNLPKSLVLRGENEPIAFFKSFVILKTQNVFENMQCLDLSNTIMLSPFAMLFGTNRTINQSIF